MQSKTAKEPTKKELVAGKDIKATQFKVGLSSKKPITTVTLGFTKVSSFAGHAGHSSNGSTQLVCLWCSKALWQEDSRCLYRCASL